MKRIAPVLLLALASGVLAQSSSPQLQSAQKPKADLIFTHGNIFTGVVDAAASLGSGKRAEALVACGYCTGFRVGGLDVLRAPPGAFANRRRQLR